MLPVHDNFPGDMDVLVDHSFWECHHCPRTVKEYDDDDCWFSILGFFNGAWYEVMQSYVCANCKEQPLTSVYKYSLYHDAQDKPNLKSVLVFELSEDLKVTPQNVDQKLATILIFS
jgi:hypothetical protein